MNHAAKQQGFTIIELVLAMTFISFLLLGIAMTVIQIGATYNRGMALREVNQQARDIGADVQRGIMSVGAIDYAADYTRTPSGLGGRLCLGSVSYIWNTEQAFESNDAGLIWYQGDTSRAKKVHLVKVPDASKVYCAKNGAGAFTRTEISNEEGQAQELLREGDHSLSVYQFALTFDPMAEDTTTQQRMYSLEYTIGAGAPSAMNTARTDCKAPGTAGADPAYCTVQQFRLVIRAGSKV